MFRENETIIGYKGKKKIYVNSMYLELKILGAKDIAFLTRLLYEQPNLSNSHLKSMATPNHEAYFEIKIKYTCLAVCI